MRQNNYQGAMQHPVHSGFTASSTAAEVIKGINLIGKVAIVTGGNTGIGLETVRALSSAGATVVVAVRDIDKAKKNLSGISNVELESVDLIDPDSIDAFAERFISSGRPLHLLIHNAGIMWVPLRRTTRGIESQLAVNYLAQFQLTARLWPALRQANGARVVNVSSSGHQFGSFNFHDPNFNHREYETLLAYGQSKTASNLFTLELDNRAKEYNVRAYAVHPGSVGGTELAREASIGTFQKMGICDADGNILPEVAKTLKTVAQGAATTVWCATSPLLALLGGVYCEDVNIAKLAVDGVPGGVKEYCLDKNDAKRLWNLSEQLTGVKFEINKEPTVANLLRKYLASVSNGDPKVTASFFAEDGFIDAPYIDSLGMPSKIIGRSAIEETMRNLMQNAPGFHFTRVDIIMETENEVVAEYESEAVLANGRSYHQLYIGHLTSRDGRITRHKEFLNTIPFVESFFPNGLKDLVTKK